MGPEIVQHPLARADGSTVLSSSLYTVIAGVNGPVEVQRRDELPEEAAIEVNLRPISGIGGPRERWLENVIQAVLKSILLVNMHPRTLIQITLQVTHEPSIKSQRTATDISIIPTLLNAAFAALVDGGLPLAATTAAALAIVREDGEVLIDPQDKQMSSFKSIHAMAFDQHGSQLLDESSGEITGESWKMVVEAAQQACIAAMAPGDGDAAMSNGGMDARPWLRETLQEQAVAAESWRET
jgi:exosome complex component RRP46